MRATLALITATVGACQMLSGLDEYGIDAQTTSTKGSGGEDSGTTMGGAAGSTTGGGQGGQNGGGGQGGNVPIPLGCPDAGPPSGVHAIDPDGEGGNPPLDVYCEQGIAGGGWTLIGRSVSGGSGNFGWREDNGTPGAMQEAYSLDVIDAQLTFSAILLLSREGGVQAYRIDVPPNFVTDHATSPLDVATTVQHVAGSCSPVNGGVPQMLWWTGYTGHDEVFWFRDLSNDFDLFGLFVDGFSVAYPNCDQGGDLEGKQGEIYVR